MIITKVHAKNNWEAYYINNRLVLQGLVLEEADLLYHVTRHQYLNPDDMFIEEFRRIHNVDMSKHKWDYLPDDLRSVLKHYGR